MLLALALADDDTEEIETYYVAEEIPLDCSVVTFFPDKYCLIKPVSGTWKDCVCMTDFLYSFDGGKTWSEARRGDEGIEVFIDGMWTNIKTVAKERGTSLQTETRTVKRMAPFLPLMEIISIQRIILILMKKIHGLVA